jgi:hypothetical protein
MEFLEGITYDNMTGDLENNPEDENDVEKF